MGWAADASSITCLAVPTSRNLAVASPGVNKFGCLGYANVRQKWLPSLGTCFSLESIFRLRGIVVYIRKKFTASQKLLSFLPFVLPAIDIRAASVRNWSNRPAVE